MATGTLERSGRSSNNQQGVQFVERPRRFGRTAPQRQGPAPDQDMLRRYFLANAGEPSVGEFDLSPQGPGVRVGDYVVALERSIMNAADAVVCCSQKQWDKLEILDEIPFCPIRKDESMMWVPTPAGKFRLWILNANHVRFSPIT